MVFIVIKQLHLGKNFIAINILGFVFSNRKPSPTLTNHEYIHTLQQREMIYIFFYIWYLAEWLIKLIIYHDFIKAYDNLSFEREAYSHQTEYEYPQNRSLYAWINYIYIK